jgi:hypothetical protein
MKSSKVKNQAITLLSEENGIGLKEAKIAFEAYFIPMLI